MPPHPQKNRPKGRQAIAGMFRLIRLENLLAVVLTQYLVRVFLVGPRNGWAAHLLSWEMLLITLASTCVVAAAYIINDYYDVKIDLINRPERVVVGRTVKRRTAMAAHTFFNFAGIGLAYTVSYKLSVLVFVLAFLLWLYSNQLKRMPLIGNLTLALLPSASIYIVVFQFGHINLPVITFMLFSFFIFTIRGVIKDMADMRGDMHFGSRTLPIIWGIRKTKTFLFALSSGFVGVIVVLLIGIGDTQLSYYFIGMAFPGVFFFRQLYRADTQQAYRQLSFFVKMIMMSGVMAITFVQ